MRTTLLDPVGVELDDISLDELDVNVAVALLAEHGVLVVRDQRADDDAFIAFLRQFGEPMFTVGETPVAGHPDLNVISNVGRTTAPRSVFHADTTYVRNPPVYTALRAVRVPAAGGETVFTNQYRAYETLSVTDKARLANRTVRHVVTGVDPGDTQEHEAEHLLFRPHPFTGRVALFLSSLERCTAISGLDDQEARATLTRLYAHSTAEGNVLRHRWRPGDVVMWDNRVVLHKADHSGVVGDRVMHRGMVSGRVGA